MSDTDVDAWLGRSIFSRKPIDEGIEAWLPHIFPEGDEAVVVSVSAFLGNDSQHNDLGCLQCLRLSGYD